MSGQRVPDDAMPAVVLHLLGFTEEGIGSAPLEPAGPGSYAVDDVVWTDAGAVAGLLAHWDTLDAAGEAEPRLTDEVDAQGPVDAEAAARAGRRVVAVADGHLVLAGDTTELPARTHAGVIYSPVTPLALRFGALFHRHDPPSPGVRQVSGTLWPRPLLCWYRQRADPEAAVFRQAREEGLFDVCDPRQTVLERLIAPTKLGYLFPAPGGSTCRVLIHVLPT